MGNVPECAPRRSYGAALIATAALLPGVAAFFTVLIFLSTCAEFPGGKYSPFSGIICTLVTWFILAAVFCRRLTDARYAIPSSYGELCLRLDQLRSQLSVLHPEDVCHIEPHKEIACKQAMEQIQRTEDEFTQSGLSWALARGYISAWNRLHLAEEAMIEVAPEETVIAGALNDVR